MSSLKLTPGRIAAIVFSLVLLVVLVSSPAVLDRARTGIEGVDAAAPGWLWVGALLFACAHAAAGLAWRRALATCDVRLDRVDAVARHAVGSLVNAVAPAQLGGAVRVALYGRACGDGGTLTAAGAAAAIGMTRVVWLVSIAAVATATGAVPTWAIALVVALGSIGVAAVFAACRFGGRRAGILVRSSVELARDRRALLAVTAYGGAVAVARVCAAAAIATAFGIPRPALAAVVVIAALDLAAILPLTPGNVGVTAAAVAFALGAHGVGAETALAAGVALSAIETLTSVAMGLAGCLSLSGSMVRPLVHRSAVAVGCATLGVAFSVTVVLPAM